MLKGLVPFLRQSEIKKIICNLAREIEKDYSHAKELILICPLRGSIFFLSDFIRQLQIPVQIDFVLIESNKTNDFTIKQDVSLEIKDKHVLIVEEIIDSGLTLSFLKNRLLLSSPASLKTVVLLDRSSHRKTFIHANYIGQSIEDRFIVGYGMDLDEEGRNYPDIYNLGQ